MSIEIPVLVAGGGPVGLAVALDLQARGIRVLLVERNPTTTHHPKLDVTNCRSMEYFRRLGFADQLRDVAVPRENGMDVVWITRLNEWELARFHYPGFHAASVHIQECNDGSQPLEPQMRLSQVVLEPELARMLKESSLADIRFGWELTSCCQDENGVSAIIREVSTGIEEEIRCQLLAGCDGAGSVTRDQLSFKWGGKHNVARIYMVHFKSEFHELLQKYGIAWHYQSPVGGTLVAQNDLDTWTLHVPVRRSVDVDSIDPVALVYESLGCEFPLEILQANLWRPHLVVADGYGRDRIWMAGDAVHQFIPTGGYGMNTGIGDAGDLAWKYAAVLEGWGGERLLQSIEAERRPVALLNCRTAEKNNIVRNELARAYDPVMHEDSVDGMKARQRYGRLILELGNAENESLGIELGYRYYKSPIICYESDEPEWDVLRYIPSTWPGVRAPHVYLEDGRAIFDLFGRGFTLLRFADVDASALMEAADTRKVPLELVDIRDQNAARIYERAMVLVRPDQHVAWRANVAPSDALAVIDRVRGA